MFKFFKDAKYVLGYAWKTDKMYIILRIPQTIVQAFIPLISVVYPAMIIEDIITKKDFHTATLHIAVMALLLVTTNFFKNLFNKLITDRYNIFESKHSMVLASKIMTVPFEETESAKTLNLLEKIKKIGYIEDSFSAIFSIITNTITMVGLVWILSEVNIFVVVIITATVLINVLIHNRIKKFQYEQKSKQGPFIRKNDYLLRLMYGFQYGKEVRINNLEPYFLRKYNEFQDEYLTYLKIGTNKYLHFNNGLSLVGIVQMAVVYFLIGKELFMGTIGVAFFTKYIAAVNSFTSTLVSITNAIVGLKTSFVYVDDLRAFLNICGEDGGADLVPANVEEFTIEFRDVSFMYPNTDQYALKDINAKITFGSKILIVGLNGSGKTTFIKLMLGLYKPTSGQILLNGIDINSYNTDSYLTYFACAFQDFRLFSFPIKENIVMMQDYEEEKLTKIMEECSLTKVVERLPRKLETNIYKFLEDDGVEFSGGENQKIAIARALYKESKVVVLDEPLAALDPIAEYDMYNSLSRITDGRTCLFISHRLSMAQNCDEIMVFSGGRIVEKGTHIELMAKENGLYAEMFHKQADFYKENEK